MSLAPEQPSPPSPPPPEDAVQNSDAQSASSEASTDKEATQQTAPPPGANPMAVDAEKKAELERMKRLALGLLIAMSVTFVLAKSFEGQIPFLAWIRAFAEAAMVGALADWFAVTALFRHPMGLPIPHTAIIPRNKDRIGETLGRFIQNNFLKPELVEARLQNVDLAGSVSRWLTDQDSSKRLAERVSMAIPKTLDAMKDETTARFVHETVTRRLAQIDIKPVVTNLLTTLTHERHHHALFNSLLELSWRMLHEHKGFIRDRIQDKSNWYIPKAVDERIYEAIVSSLDETLIQLRDPNNELRQAADDAITDFVMGLADNDDALKRVDIARNRFLQNERMQDYFREAWEEAKQAIIRDAAKEDSAARRGVQTFFVQLGQTIENDPAIRDQINTWLRTAIIRVILPYRESIGGFIANVVKNWDTEMVTDKIETSVGKDLQFIRVNGTLVGGLVGLTIHLIWEIVTSF